MGKYYLIFSLSAKRFDKEVIMSRVFEDFTKFKKEDLILRDYLAYDRTKLALTRTILGIIRTALGLYASGIGLLILQESRTLIGLGYIVTIVATIVMIAGTAYWWRYKKHLDSLKED